MDNTDISRIFAEIADILEIKGEGVFRVNAYRRASHLVLDLPTEMREHGTVEELEKFPGIGAALARKIRELVDTGSLEFLDKLRKDPLAKLVELTKIPGLGPKRVKLFHERLGIKTIDELEAAAHKGLIAKLPLIKEKTEANILKGIAVYKKMHQRIPLDKAREYAQTLTDQIRKWPEVKQLEVAGSLRRERETIGDIDILVISAEPQVVIEKFVGLAEVEEILAKGDTKGAVRSKWGVQVDLRVLAAKSFGAALMYFTGSKEHNILLRRIAISKGMKLSEYGLFKGKDYYKGKTEAEIYQALGLHFIPPTERENSEQIEKYKIM
ncbi:MAG: type-X family DNA polymerase [Candidatus Gracilibacteria bacterium]|nr:type-X family DNA polymerase [Candidatus Gracilibacteria bacterium]